MWYLHDSKLSNQEIMTLKVVDVMSSHNDCLPFDDIDAFTIWPLQEIDAHPPTYTHAL